MIDLIWEIDAHAVHAEYHYCLYSALKKVAHDVATHPDVQVGPLELGKLIKRDVLYRPRRWRVRGPVDVVTQLIGLRGHALAVGQSLITLKEATARGLEPRRTLHSPLVTFSFTKDGGRSGYDDDRVFHAVAGRLGELGVGGALTMGRPGGVSMGRGIYHRGVAVQVTGLTDAGALKLLERGLGGKRHMGAGVFLGGELPGDFSARRARGRRACNRSALSFEVRYGKRE